MKEEEIIEALKNEGYKPVYAYDAEADEVDEEHSHTFDTRLVVVRGDIRIKTVRDGAVMDIVYKAGDVVDIPKNQTHSATAGSEGSRYIVAEGHTLENSALGRNLE